MPGIRRRQRIPVAPRVPAVIIPRMGVGQECDHRLETSKELYRLSRAVTPSSRDAVMDVVRLLVMCRMLRVPKHDAALLQRANELWRGRHVRPLMNLIRHHPYGAEHEAENRRRASPACFDRNYEEAEKDWQHEKRGIAVGVDESSLEQ